MPSAFFVIIQKTLSNWPLFLEGYLAIGMTEIQKVPDILTNEMKEDKIISETRKLGIKE